MASRIKETPVLYGKDAIRFLKRAKEVEEGMYKVSTEDYNRAMKTYREIESVKGV